MTALYTLSVYLHVVAACAWIGNALSLRPEARKTVGAPQSPVSSAFTRGRGLGSLGANLADRSATRLPSSLTRSRGSLRSPLGASAWSQKKVLQPNGRDA